MQSLAELERLADQLPSMGGKQIGALLRKLVREAPQGSAVVEVGSWLGAGTAQLALGVRDRGPGNELPIFAYDRWEASDQEVEKAQRAGLNLQRGVDTLPWVKDTLRPLGVDINYIKGDILAAQWSGMPIGVYVDDAAKTPKKFFHVIRTFGPSWIPGVTVLILMDYYMWEKTGSEQHKCQKYFVESHPEHFKLSDFRRNSNAAVLYTKALNFHDLGYEKLLRPHTPEAAQLLDG